MNKHRAGHLIAGLAISLSMVLAFGVAQAKNAAAPRVVSLPGGAPGIGFDDLVFDEASKTLLIPGGRSGNLYRIDPASAEASVLVGGFSSSKSYEAGGHDFGLTSVSVLPNGLIAVTDRTSQTLSLVDPARKAIVEGATVSLGVGPDLVRYIAATDELWITEPDSHQLEIYKAPTAAAPKPVKSGAIQFKDGPEALVIDEARGAAYTNAGADTVVIDLKTRQVSAGWTSGCKDPKEIAVDAKRGFAFNVCKEGGIYAYDLKRKPIARVGHVKTGRGADIPGFSESLSHLYVAGGVSKTLTFVGVARNGSLSVLGKVTTAIYASDAVADNLGHAWVPRPKSGDMLRFDDPYPASAN